MELKTFENSRCIWKPIGIRGTNYERFLNLIRDKYHVALDDYWDLHKWSVENIPAFWGELWTFVGIKCSKRFEKVVDLSIPMSKCPKWFIGARLNIAENFLRFRDDKVALTSIGENRDETVITFAQMYEEVKLYAAAFRKSGLKKEDTVICHLSNREEAIIAMFAVASIGAIWVGTLPMLGAQAVLDRVNLVNPKYLLAGDRFQYNGQENDMLEKAKFLSKGLPSLEKVIIVPTMPNSMEKDISDIPNSCFLNEFLDLGKNADGSVPDLIFEQLPFSHPFVISYTSGTTGPPKAIVHDYGCLITFARDQFLTKDTERSDVYLNVSAPGWVSWILSIGVLYVGHSILLYDGVPYFCTPTYFWDLIDKYKISSMMFTPSILDEMEKKGYEPTKKHKLSSLKSAFAGASVVRSQNYNFVYQKIKPGMMFYSAYGSTEAMGICLMMHFSLPIYDGEIACPSLGTNIEILNEAGESVLGEVGGFYITKPIPTLPLGLYGDEDGSKFEGKYFSKYSDKFDTGDLAAINPVTKGTFIYGRSDEVLKQFGCRFGSSEIYGVVSKMPEVFDSLCVAQYSKNKDERAVLFLKMKEDYQFDDEFVRKVRDSIENELTDEHIPGLIMECPEIPYNLNGKKMELMVKKIINNMPYNPDTVRNKDSLEFFKDIPPFLD